MFKQTAIAALVLGFSGAASAAMYQPAPVCAAGTVTVPCEKSAWDLGVDALYLRAEDHQSSAVPITTSKRMDQGWGFRLEGSYHFGSGNDVVINWSRYDKTTKNITTTPTHLTNKFDMVNFELGQQVNLAEKVVMRFQGGLQYIDLTDHDVDTTAAPNVQKNEMTGFGVRAGLGVKYSFTSGYYAYADSNLGLLAFQMKQTTAALAQTTVHGTALTTDASVGVAYIYEMAQGDLTARVGWGVKHINLNNVITNASNGYGWSGFNLGLKWVGNA